MANSIEIPFPTEDLLFMREDKETSIRNGDVLLGTMERASIKIGEYVLDIGCGYGRMAYALNRRGFDGEYLGLEIMKKYVDWLDENVSTISPNYQFRHLDVKNKRYNPDGAADPSEMVFPKLKGPPSLIMCFSVFTHMYPEDIQAYLKKIAAIMNPESVLFATFFQADDAFRTKNPKLNMRHELSPGVYYCNKADKIHAIGFSSSLIHQWIDDAGLDVRTFLPGSWCGRPESKSYQDAFVICKK